VRLKLALVVALALLLPACATTPEPLSLALESPRVKGAITTIAGRVTPANAQVMVNGQAVTVDRQGYFRSTVALPRLGTQFVVVEAESRSGRTTEIVEVTRRQASLGEEIILGRVHFALTGVERVSSLGEGVLKTRAQGEFLVVHLAVRNELDTPVSLEAQGFALTDDEGNTYLLSDRGAFALGWNDYLAGKTLSPGHTMHGYLVFDVAPAVRTRDLTLLAYGLGGDWAAEVPLVSAGR